MLLPQCSHRILPVRAASSSAAASSATISNLHRPSSLDLRQTSKPLQGPAERPALLRPRPLHPSVFRLIIMGRPPRSRSASIISVSYTHLRAHETDSYLVCRLL